MSNPYEPKYRAPVIDPSALPMGRLRRLGIDDEVLTVVRGEWDALDFPARCALVENLAVLTDEQVVAALRSAIPASKPARSTTTAKKAP